MKAVVFCRPCRSSIDKLKWHLQNPIYPEYFIYFSNIITEDVIRELAESDRREVVQCVQEYFIDFRAIDQHHFTFELRDNVAQLVPPNMAPQRASIARDRVVEGLLALCLAIKRKPVIRFSEKSEKVTCYCYHVLSTCVDTLQLHIHLVSPSLYLYIYSHIYMFFPARRRGRILLV